MSKSKEIKKKLVLLKESSLLEIQNLLEDEVKNGTSGAPIFKKIADNIALYEGL